MKHCLLTLVLVSCAICALGDEPRPAASKNDLKVAHKTFEHALKLQKEGRIEEAFQEVSKAATLAPGNMEYLTALELLRSRIAGSMIDRGNLLAEIGDSNAAQAQFKQALNIDPQNGYAQERLYDVTPDDPEHQHVLQLLASVEDVHVNPKPGKQDFHVRGDTRDLYEAIGRAFGVSFDYDQSLTSQRVRFDIDKLDFYAAMRLAEKLTKTFWAPISSNRVMIANDNQEMRRQYQRMSLQTFYVAGASSAAELNDVANIIRNVFEVRLTSIVPSQDIITVRAPKEQMAVISAILDDLMQGRPEILLDIKAYEVSYDKQRQFGLALPTNFTIFNIFSEIYRALGPAAPGIIDQLKKTGTIDPSKVPVGSLGGLQGSPLLQPFLFFGKGWGLTGITVTPIGAHLSSNDSSSKSLEHATIRASSSNPATLKIGTRIPLQLASFTNVSLSQNGLPVVGSAVPQIQYEDIGLTFKATPHLQTEDNVNLELQLEIKGLGATQANGLPVITNRSYSGSITVKDGEPSVLAGMIEELTSRSTSGYPGVGQLPFLSGILNTNFKDHSHKEILVVVTPHVIRKSFHRYEPIVWDPSQ